MVNQPTTTLQPIATVQIPTQLDNQAQTGQQVSIGSTQPQAVTSTIPNIEIGAIPVAISLLTFIFVAGIAWGTLRSIVSGIQKSIDNKIEPDLKDIRERFAIVEDRVNSLWKDELAPANSPRQLNDRGMHILNESGIKKIIEENKEKLLDLVRKQKAKNPYDAEVAILSVVAELSKHCPDSVDQLKTGAFNTGADIDAVLFVGGIYLRDLIFEELGFKLHDLDKKN